MACEAGGKHRNWGGEKEDKGLGKGGKPGAKQRAGLRALAQPFFHTVPLSLGHHEISPLICTH